MSACAPGLASVQPFKSNVCGGGTFRAAVFHTVLTEDRQLIALTRHASEGVTYRIERAVSFKDVLLTLAVIYKRDLSFNATVVVLVKAQMTELYRLGIAEITVLEDLEHVGDL